ncbi:MAG: hypothetical protein U9R42_00520, partial [Bacteroidota bacterium]|nr:hypothetical protein [Bacteroidota bacterium]
LEGNFWKNQALTDILPYWTKYSIDTVDGAFITNLDRSFNQIEGLSVKIEEVTINGENRTDFNKDEGYINLPALEKVEMKVVLK